MLVDVRLTDPDSVAGAEALLPPVSRLDGPPSSFLHQVYRCVSITALTLVSYFIISHYIVQAVTVVGSSMTPTLRDSGRYLLNRWVYFLRVPHRSDVVVIRDPLDHGFAVKRVIAVSGDSVYLKDGNVYLNGRKLSEPYLAPGMATFAFSRAQEQLFTCGRDQYFVLGDNRRNSIDSRVYGPVPRRNVLGLIIP